MRIILLNTFLFLYVISNAQVGFEKLKSVSNKAQKIIQPQGLTNNDVANGLKEALTIGVINSSAIASKKGGFNTNVLIKIPFPKDAKKMQLTLSKVGLQSQVDKFVHVLNEAAEDASILAKDIFINAVKSMTINDALSILNGDDSAATMYLRNQTLKSLYIEFKPVVSNSIKKVGLTKYWNVLAERYNSIPLTKNVNTDLEDYITTNAINGLFILIAKEEKNIRENPDARVSEILEKVFK